MEIFEIVLDNRLGFCRVSKTEPWQRAGTVVQLGPWSTISLPAHAASEVNAVDFGLKVWPGVVRLC